MFSSIFTRKDKPDPRKTKEAVLREQMLAQSPSTQPGVATTTTQAPDPREVARLTAEKIDRIESEMIAAGLPVPPPPKRVAQAAAVAAAAPVAATKESSGGKTLPMLDFGTSVVLGDPSNADQILVSGSSLDPQLEEAAILYANNQTEAAAATLRVTIQNPGVQQQAWWMLFDVLHCLNDKEAFESLSLDYAARFEASPPAWRDNASRAAPVEPKTKSGAGPSVVRFPAQIDGSVTRLIEVAHKASVNKRLVVFDFTKVKQIDAAAINLLQSVIEGYKKQKRELSINGAEILFHLVRATVEAGVRADNETHWLLSMDLLRLMGARQQFDDLSIDYCVTFEVSPPAFEPMPEWIRTENGEALGGSTIHATVGATQFDTAPLADGGQAFALSGELLGRLQKELAALRVYAADRSDVVIDCRDLLRLDFVAAGELLNECVTMRNQGKQILIVEPSAIVLALMLVMGIHELTEIRTRKA